MKKGILHTAFMSLIAVGILILLLLLGTIIPGYDLSALKTNTKLVKKHDTNHNSKILPVDTSINNIKKTKFESNIKSYY